MTQLTLADVPEPLPFQRGSETSRQAAEQAAPSAKTLRAAVLRHIAGKGAFGATDEEIALALQLNPSTARPRRIELVDRGEVRDSGAKRETRSGRLAVVWCSVQHAVHPEIDRLLAVMRP
jgi:hypothetical protein